MPLSDLALLEAGRKILDPVFERHGYRFTVRSVSRGSGGTFAVGAYEKGSRAVELHVRRALGIVIYQIGDASLDHRDYVGCLGGAESAYPGFSEDPRDGFRHLAADLEGLCSPFFSEANDDAFRRCAELVRENPKAFRPHGLPG